MRKTEDDTYNLIEGMALNNFKSSAEWTQPKQVGGKHEVDVIALLSANVDAMTHRLEQMSVNAVNSGAPSSYESCGSAKHITLNCQVRSPFPQDPNELSYVQNFNPRLTNDPYSNTYNPGWKNQPSFPHRLNPNTVNMPPVKARVPPGFQRPPFPSQMP